MNKEISYQVGPANFNPKPNSFQRINEKKTTVAKVPKKILNWLQETNSHVNEKITNFISDEEFKNITSEAIAFIRERVANLIRVRRLEEKKENAGFALISILMFVGLIGLSVIVFLTIRNTIH